ncbi:hypothetical protein PIB30_083711 [Stylosanthes scabra]|uniref:Uncharacterized protein n=1 Tax=Stylosanthes scabra TaxID=79078 RepID=A0ABU6TUK7_9FABA|nr:hypothetical protein [Stylosanthes scabra]
MLEHQQNHPNLGWGGSQNPKSNNFQNRPPYQPFQRPPFPQQQPNIPPAPQPKPPQTTSFEAALEKLTLTTTISKQLSTKLPNAFPSDTEVNPKGECKAITLRSGKALEDISKKVNVQPIKEDDKGEASNEAKV